GLAKTGGTGKSDRNTTLRMCCVGYLCAQVGSDSSYFALWGKPDFNSADHAEVQIRLHSAASLASYLIVRRSQCELDVLPIFAPLRANLYGRKGLIDGCTYAQF